MNSDRFAYIRERMMILDLIGYTMERRPAQDKTVLLWMPEHPTMPVFTEIMRLAGYHVRQTYAYNDDALARLAEEWSAHADYVIDYDGTCPHTSGVPVTRCKAGEHCLAKRRLFKPFLSSEAEMLCVIDLLQATLDLLFNGVNVVIDGYNERAVALGRYLRDRACNVSFDTGDPIDRLEITLSGGRVSAPRAYANADMLFVTCEDDALPAKLMQLKDECIVVNCAGRDMTGRMNAMFAQLGDSPQTLDALYTRTRDDGAKLHLMFRGDDAAARGFRHMSYEAVDMIYTGCAMAIDAMETGTAQNEEDADAKIARIKLSLIVE